MPLATENTQRTTTEPSRRFVTIAKSDTVDLTSPVRSLHPNTSGWIRVTGLDNDDDSYHEFYVLAGVPFPGQVKRVWSTVAGGTAADVVGLL